MSKQNNIPSAEEFERASKYMEGRFRNLDQVEKAVFLRFKSVCPLHAFDLLPQGDVDFRAYVFFEKDEDIKVSRNSGVIQQIVDCVYSELERAGRGMKADIRVAFEFDSDENVAANYGGNYFLRLR